MPKLVFKLSDTQSLDFPLAGDHVRLGRNAANDIVIDNSWISSFHAEFRLSPDGVTEVRDLHSSNGTTVNGQRIESARLSSGDTVAFGQLEAIFDPVPENLSGPNGSASRAVKPAEIRPPPEATKGPRPAKLPGIVRAPVPQPVHPLPRAAATEPVPSANLSSRLATPPALPSTAAVPVGEMPAEVRRELQKAHAELAGVRSEMKSLAEQVETLRRDRESEEQNQAQMRLQGEREARELRSRLEKLQEEIEQSETAAADSAKARNEKLSGDEEELAIRVAGLKSTSETADAAIKAQEERLAALKNEEAALAAVSAKLHSAMHQAVELENRNAAAAAAIAGAESRAAGLQQGLAEKQQAAETARSDEAAATTAAAVAAQNLQQIQAQTAAAAGLLAAKEAELGALLCKFDVSLGEAAACAARLAEQEKATAAATESLAGLTAETAALSERRDALDVQIKTAETLLAGQNARLGASGDTLRELESAQSRLAEIEAAIADYTAKAKIAAVAAEADEKRKGAVATELDAAKEELRRELASRESAVSQLDQRKACLTEEVEALVADISTLVEKRAAASRSLAETTTQMESLTEKMAAARAEAEALELLRADTVALKARVNELNQEVRHLEDRQQTFAAAPDANWGTVHAISKGIIKQVDLLDDLIQHHVTHNGSRESIEQMSIFRAGLADILVEYNVEPYRFEPGFTVDVSTRKKIQIVESREESGEGTRIEKTWRPGYICTNGAVGVQTLLRKAEVSIVIGK